MGNQKYFQKVCVLGHEHMPVREETEVNLKREKFICPAFLYFRTPGYIFLSNGAAENK